MCRVFLVLGLATRAHLDGVAPVEDVQPDAAAARGRAPEEAGGRLPEDGRGRRRQDHRRPDDEDLRGQRLPRCVKALTTSYM